MSTERRKSHENIFCVIESHGIDKKMLFKWALLAEKPVKQRFLSNNLTKLKIKRQSAKAKRHEIGSVSALSYRSFQIQQAFRLTFKIVQSHYQTV